MLTQKKCVVILLCPADMSVILLWLYAAMVIRCFCCNITVVTLLWHYTVIVELQTLCNATILSLEVEFPAAYVLFRHCSHVLTWTPEMTYLSTSLNTWTKTHLAFTTLKKVNMLDCFFYVIYTSKLIKIACLYKKKIEKFTLRFN